MNTTNQTVSPTVLKQYRVDASLRFEGADTVQSIAFVISAEGGKAAWVEARRITRVGGEVQQIGGKTETIKLSAGLYTVRNVIALEKSQPKPKLITIETLLAAAEAENIGIPKKLQDLISRLRSPAAAEAPKSNENTSVAA